MICRAIAVSSQAFLNIVAETYTHLHTETGGILLGARRDDTWYVIDAIDPGYRGVLRRPGYFEYDVEYVTHLANVRARLYANGIELLGLWHRHPGSLDRFSSTDDETHRLYVAQNANGALSILVNVDPDLRLTAYYISPTMQHTRVADIAIGDSHIPAQFLAVRTPESYMGQSTQRVATEPRRGVRDSLKGVWTNLTGTAKSETTSSGTSAQADLVLDMLDSELAQSLENQNDYDYTIVMRDNSVEIVMSYVGAMPFYPRQIGCRLFVLGKTKWCEIDDRAMTQYSPGVIRRYVNQAVEQRAGVFDEPSPSTTSARGTREQEAPTGRETHQEAIHSDAQSLDGRPSDAKWESVRAYAEKFGLSYGFSKDELRTAYHQVMKDVHPDVWHSEGNAALVDAASRETQRVLEAYNALTEYSDERDAA